MRRPSVSVVVPVHDSEATLAELVARIDRALRPEVGGHEVILVNDRSRDASWDVIESLAREQPWIRGIDLARNVGQHRALLCGTRHARGAVVVTLDDDLQHPPEEIPKLLARLTDGFDVVYGTPGEDRRGRGLGSRAARLLLRRAVGPAVARQASAFRAFRTELRGVFAGHGGRIVCLDVLLSWARPRFGAVEVRHDVRRNGSSRYTVRKRATAGRDVLLGVLGGHRPPDPLGPRRPSYTIRRQVNAGGEPA